MTDTITILGIAGSLRHSSFNTALLRAPAAAPAGCTADIDMPEAMARLRRTNFRIRPEVLNATLARDAERRRQPNAREDQGSASLPFRSPCACASCGKV